MILLGLQRNSMTESMKLLLKKMQSVYYRAWTLTMNRVLLNLAATLVFSKLTISSIASMIMQISLSKKLKWSSRE